jgi:DNA polymerase III epsilon subunit-like protein
MKYAVIDTENTGLFIFKDKVTGVPVAADAPGQPRLASLGMILLDDDLRETDEIHLYVKPDGWSMPQGPNTAGAVNGLTDEFLEANGTPVSIVLNRYVEIIDAGYTLVAYNAQHDLKQMRAELRRAGMNDRFESTPNICVMRASMKLGVKKAGGGGGFPKLSDVCAHLGIDHQAAHSAGGDARAALEVFRHLHSIDGLPDARVHYAKVPPQHVTAPPTAPTLADVAPAALLPERF